jgi:hypothetical protein
MPWRPIGLWNVENPTFCRQSAHKSQLSCQPYELAAFYWINVRAIVWLERWRKLKIFIHLIGSLTLNLPDCNMASQPSLLLLFSERTSTETWLWRTVLRRIFGIYYWFHSHLTMLSQLHRLRWMRIQKVLSFQRSDLLCGLLNSDKDL